MARVGALPVAVAVGLVLGLAAAPAAADPPPSPDPPPPLCCPWWSDYNGDHHGDVLTSDIRDVAGFTRAGAVSVVYSDANGLTTAGSQLITMATPGVPGGGPSANAFFGHAVASGDFDEDGYGDAAIGGNPLYAGPGQVVVLYGSSRGLHGTREAQAKAELLTPEEHLPRGVRGDTFGIALATGDVDWDGHADLAIGDAQANLVVVLHGTPDGLEPGAGVTAITPQTPGLPWDFAAGDVFGHSLVFGDFNGDHHDDLAVGAPGRVQGDAFQAGEVFVFYSDKEQITLAGAQSFTQNTPGVPETSEPLDHFGWALASGNLSPDFDEELAIGAPSEKFNDMNPSGQVTVLRGSPSGVTTTGASMLTGAGDSQFGSSLAVVPMDTTYLAVGAPAQAVGPSIEAGAVYLFPRSPEGPTPVGSSVWTLDTAGMPGPAAYGDAFGNALKPILLGDDITYPYQLVVSAIGRDSGALVDAGGLFLIRAAKAPTATGSQYIDPATLVGGAVATAGLGYSLG